MWMEHAADCSAEVKNEWSCSSFTAWCCYMMCTGTATVTLSHLRVMCTGTATVTLSHLRMMSCAECSEIKHRIHMIKVVLEGRPVLLILTLPLIINILHHLDVNRSNFTAQTSAFPSMDNQAITSTYSIWTSGGILHTGRGANSQVSHIAAAGHPTALHRLEMSPCQGGT